MRAVPTNHRVDMHGNPPPRSATTNQIPRRRDPHSTTQQLVRTLQRAREEPVPKTRAQDIQRPEPPTDLPPVPGDHLAVRAIRAPRDGVRRLRDQHRAGDGQLRDPDDDDDNDREAPRAAVLRGHEIPRRRLPTARDRGAQAVRCRWTLARGHCHADRARRGAWAQTPRRLLRRAGAESRAGTACGARCHGAVLHRVLPTLLFICGGGGGVGGGGWW